MIEPNPRMEVFMCTKRWVMVGVLIVAVALLTVAIPVLLPTTPGVTYANYSRLDRGMTGEQVVKLLGEPTVAEPFRGTKVDSVSHLVWLKDDDEIEVFLENDAVTRIAWNYEWDERSMLEKLRDRLPWIARHPPLLRERK